MQRTANGCFIKLLEEPGLRAFKMIRDTVIIVPCIKARPLSLFLPLFVVRQLIIFLL